MAGYSGCTGGVCVGGEANLDAQVHRNDRIIELRRRIRLRHSLVTICATSSGSNRPLYRLLSKGNWEARVIANEMSSLGQRQH